ncbi:hypothetical protein AAG570_006168 [Ranatra chinensis]|uniref:Uncharacterized protein n=1 Tax=Ranatra chinensis TaxID=642074 RepID=A0ABD0YFN6_9HEMI
MLNLYKTMARNQAEKEEYTGHDRFYQPPHDLHISRRKKRSLHHHQRHHQNQNQHQEREFDGLEPPVRTRSQPEMGHRPHPDTDASSAQVVAASLAKLFPCVSAQPNDNRTQQHRNRTLTFDFLPLNIPLVDGQSVGLENRRSGMKNDTFLQSLVKAVGVLWGAQVSSEEVSPRVLRDPVRRRGQSLGDVLADSVLFG